MKKNLYPHVFQPLKIRGVTLKNRLQYAPTVVLKCSPEGDVTKEMTDFMKWQAKTGVGYITVGDTPVVRGNSSAWMCEMNVCEDRCIHGMRELVEAACYNGAEISVELAHAGRGTPTVPGGPPAECTVCGRSEKACPDSGSRGRKYHKPCRSRGDHCIWKCECLWNIHALCGQSAYG